MKIPEQIKIGPYTFKIKYIDRLWVKEDCRGQFCPDKAEIQLDSEMSEQYKEEVFVHEIVEAIKWSYNLDIKHQDLNTLGMVLTEVMTSFEESKI